ncbi:hypothetical protein [Candidatus Nitrotoga arctica]|uniref:CBM-cenC domain-containing protein n=1 Tax=Candidatus Nitrotoga arctica TaxID=453162 RepID=A0ABN8ALY5_9PROT|nr:hypothetical protein [Candidatus Nitrotoga arctica]CAG9933789.1 conserved exported protein of unknown function [Candidatus Nitrotoga arctica]
MNNSISHLWVVLLLAGYTNHALSADTPSAPATSAVTQVAVPPAALSSLFARRQARRPAPDAVISLKNPSFNPDKLGKMSPWVEIEHGSGNSYTFVADAENALSIPSSARIRRHGSEPFGLLQQSISVHSSWHNKTVRLAGSLRGVDISGAGGALVLRADDGSGQILAWNFMQNVRVKGTQDWKQYTIELKIPSSAYSLIVGVMLEDGGTLWADNLTIELID